VLTGEHVALRAIEPADLETLRAWRNDPRMRRNFRERNDISPEQQRAWYERMSADPNQHLYAIEAGGRLVGAGGLLYVDTVSKLADFSLYIGDAYVDDTYAPDAARVLLDHAFGDLGLHRVWVEVYAFDTKKQALVERLGFTLDGRHRDHRYEDGAWHDSLFYGLLDGEWRP
jgi:RimJ/RimL family protein N-acetyltransferase